MRLTDKLGHGFVLTAEVDPPRGADPAPTLKQALILRGYVDAVNVSDAPMANLRMNSIMLAHLIQHHTGVEVIPHLTARDRNRLALQADLLGAWALGVKNVLVLGGDPPERGDHPEARPVYEFGAVGLVETIARLNRGENLSGGSLESAPDLTPGVAVNPGAADLAAEAEKFWAKVEAGARFAQSQPVFCPETAAAFLDALGGRSPVPILWGVLPLRSLKMARNVARWTRVPEALVADLEREGRAAGMRAAQHVLRELHAAGMDGAHLYPLGRVELLKEMLKPLGARLG
ncbi:methylenetetrahydrofolate reductase [Oceanithermus sp.]|uniref:methylenetetrahydrofolate reductase n=1 Tax=Oceanithermus sp. TaxID=2268145 RepID=UPI00257A77D0|nr:methylenetetrahydrofolate reductase [Oceanithermus sp.]